MSAHAKQVVNVSSSILPIRYNKVVTIFIILEYLLQIDSTNNYVLGNWGVNESLSRNLECLPPTLRQYKVVLLGGLNFFNALHCMLLYWAYYRHMLRFVDPLLITRPSLPTGGKILGATPNSSEHQASESSRKSDRQLVEVHKN